MTNDRYDFIVVGAGAAGSVLAGELSASGAHVLVIESGAVCRWPSSTSSRRCPPVSFPRRRSWEAPLRRRQRDR